MRSSELDLKFQHPNQICVTEISPIICFILLISKWGGGRGITWFYKIMVRMMPRLHTPLIRRGHLPAKTGVNVLIGIIAFTFQGAAIVPGLTHSILHTLVHTLG